MGPETERLCNEFQYTAAQRQVIIGCLYKAEQLPRRVRFDDIPIELIDRGVDSMTAPADQARIQVLELLAVRCLKKAFAWDLQQDKKDQLTDVRRIIRRMEALVDDFESEDYREVKYKKRLDIFLDFDFIEGFPSIEKLTDDMKLVLAHKEIIIRQFEYMSDNPYKYAEQGYVTDFVLRLCAHWSLWTGQEARGSKETGPTSRFVMHCIRPVESYAKTVLRRKLRPRGKRNINESIAGNLIYEAKKFYIRLEKESPGEMRLLGE